MVRLALAAALALAPVAATAAQSDNATPAQNLDCAIWASIVIGNSDDEAVTSGLGMILGYFIGLYEAATGNDIDEAMVARASVITETELEALDTTCSARMVAYGERLGALGSRMQAMGGEAPAN